MKQTLIISLLYMMFGFVHIHAQNTLVKDIQSSNLISLLKEDTLAQALEKIQLFDLKQFKFDSLVKKMSYWLDGKLDELEFKNQTSLGVNNYYFSNTTAIDSLNYKNQLFTGIDITNRANLFGIPLKILGNITLRNGQYDGQFSDFAVQFDQRAFLQNLKKRKLQDLSWNTLQSEEKTILSAIEKKAIIQELRFTLYKKIMDNPQFRKTKDLLYYQLDSIKQKNLNDTSLLKEQVKNIETLCKKYQEQIDLVLKVEKKFIEAWENKNKYQDSLIQQVKNKLHLQKQRVDNWANPRSWQTDSIITKLNLGSKALLALEDLAIGQFSITGSDFTLFQMPLQGGQIKISSPNWYGEVATGRQRLQFGFAPSFGRLLFNPGGKKYFNYAVVGIGSKEKNHFQLALCEGTERNLHKDTLPILNKKNLIWEASGQLSIASNWALKFTAAISELALGGSEYFIQGERAFSAAKSAAKLQMVYFSPRKNNQLAIGYFYTGSEFFTLGNPFLRSNWSGLSIDGHTRILGDRILLKGNAKYGSIQDSKSVNNRSNELQFFGQFNWRINRKSHLNLQVLPNRFVQSGYAQEKITGSQNLYQLQWNQLVDLRHSNCQIMSTIGLSNYQFNYQFIDSINSKRALYGTIQQSLIFHSGDGLTGSFTSTTQNLNKLDDWLLQFEFNKQSKIISWRFGLQAIQQHWYKANKAGMSVGMQFKGNPKYKFGFNFIYRRPIKGTELPQIIGNCSFYTTI